MVKKKPSFQVGKLATLPRNEWSDVCWGDDPTQVLRVWRDTEQERCDMFYLDSEGPIEWIAVEPTHTPFFFPASKTEAGFFYERDFRAWLGRYVSKETRDSDVYKVRQFSLPAGKDGRQAARLAVSPELFLACCLERFQTKRCA